VSLRNGRLTGTIAPEGSEDSDERVVEEITWSPEAGNLRFRTEENGRTLWYVMNVGDGVLTGRYAASVASRLPPEAWTHYSGHLVGWRSESFDAELAPRVFDLHTTDGRYVRIRIDRSATGAPAFIGELKINATDQLGAAGELPLQSMTVRSWDGQRLAFDIVNGSTRERFAGSVRGRAIKGTISADRAGTVSDFSGFRANVLSYGLRTKSQAERAVWQERVRRALSRLMMAGNPAPIDKEAIIVERPLFQTDKLAPGRDDNPARWERAYRVWDVVLTHKLPNPYGPEPLTRRSHGFLAVPTTPPPPGGYPAVLSLNGHYGSALGQFQPDNFFWYGDAFARRGYVVLALDISHRPLTDANGLYNDPVDGDRPDEENHAHPAIAAPGLDSDWVDDGERAWDAMRGIDFLLTQPNINRTRLIMTGLSMGGHVTEIASALDPRVTSVIPAGASPDLALMSFQGVHTCWLWSHGHPLEFIDTSDYLALIAPRQVVLEDGKWDWLYSHYTTRFVVQKEGARRARIAYGDEAANFVHFLHSGSHDYRVGDATEENPRPEFIQVPHLLAPPTERWRTGDWAVDGETVSLGKTLFDLLEP